MYKKKGFTLVELLVVIAIIALLMGILMPALARVRNIAMRMSCGTNLSALGKAILIYAGDYDDEFPRSGYGTNSTLFKSIEDWIGVNNPPYGPRGNPYYGQMNITSCLFLLIKYADVMPKLLVCKNDGGAEIFQLGEMKALVPGNILDGMELIDLWDLGQIFTGDENIFGSDKYCSYSYQHPLTLYYLTTTSLPGLAVLADRNPWLSCPSAEFGRSDDDRYDVEHAFDNDQDPDWQAMKRGNAIGHQEEGQNVLFADIHVEFEKLSSCGIDDDNIYTYNIVDEATLEPADTFNIEVGILPPKPPVTDVDFGCKIIGKPGNRRDSYLISNMLGADG